MKYNNSTLDSAHLTTIYGHATTAVPEERAHSHFVGLLIIAGSVMAFCETAVILLVICTNQDMFSSSYHFLIGNLMVSDLLVALMGLCFRGPGLIDHTFSQNTFLSYLCHVVPFVIWSGLYWSSLAVLCITYNRMLALTDPLKYNSKSTKLFCLRLVRYTWLIVLLYFVSSFTLFHVDVFQMSPTPRCLFDTDSPGIAFIDLCDTLFFVLPLVAILVMYRNIVNTMMRDRVRVTRRPSLMSVRRDLFKNITLLLLLFTVSWLPNYTYNLIKYIRYHLGGVQSPNNLLLEDVLVIMFYSNLVFDPLVYGLGCEDFKKRVLKLVTSKARRMSSDISRRLSQISSGVGNNKCDVGVLEMRGGDRDEMRRQVVGQRRRYGTQLTVPGFEGGNGTIIENIVCRRRCMTE